MIRTERDALLWIVDYAAKRVLVDPALILAGHKRMEQLHLRRVLETAVYLAVMALGRSSPVIQTELRLSESAIEIQLAVTRGRMEEYPLVARDIREAWQHVADTLEAAGFQMAASRENVPHETSGA